MTELFGKALEIIKRYDRVILHRHKNPDGDALGAQIGLKQILKDNFPEKEIYAVGDMSARFSPMDGSKMDEIPDAYYENALVILLDMSAASLISDERYRTAKETVRFDHHLFVEKIADFEIVDTSAESCCGLITSFAMATGLTVTAPAAQALYTGMVTDSGRFRYDATTSETFLRASFLLERPFKTGDIFSWLYADELASAQLRAGFILRIMKAKNNVAYIYTDRALADTLGADDFTMSRGMVNVMSDLRGIDVWVNFVESATGVLCEIRSSKYNINPVAVKYGGGGHAKASGATLKDKNEAMALVADLEALSAQGGIA